MLREFLRSAGACTPWQDFAATLPPMGWGDMSALLRELSRHVLDPGSGEAAAELPGAWHIRWAVRDMFGTEETPGVCFYTGPSLNAEPINRAEMRAIVKRVRRWHAERYTS